MIQDWIIPMHVEFMFFTDDNFQFSNALKALNNFFEDLEVYDKAQDIYEDEFNDKNRVFKALQKPEEAVPNDLGIVDNEWMYDNIEDFSSFYDFIRRKYFFRTLEVVFPLYKTTWAKATIKTFLKKIYQQKEKFNEKEIETLNDMMDEINSKIGVTSLKSNTSKYLDQKIRSDAAQSFNPVADGRSNRIVADNLGTWASRQY